MLWKINGKTPFINLLFKYCSCSVYIFIINEVIRDKRLRLHTKHSKKLN